MAFAPELLLAHNMVCHLACYRTSRVRALGGFREGFEGSQDYDLVGYTKEQIINDILDQYERHMQFLHLVR